MIYPDYKNSIVNVSSSILDSFGVKPLYNPLSELSDLKKYKNIILLVIDGLGSEYLKKYGKDSFLNKNLVKPITSVFPTTTTTAVTSIQTGVAPQQHGLTGWFMFLKELGCIYLTFPLHARFEHKKNKHIKKTDLISYKRIADRIKSPSFIVSSNEVVNLELNQGNTNMKPYSTLNGMFRQIKKSIGSSDKRKYIYSYWPWFDNICHHKGYKSIDTRNHFWDLDKSISSFVKSIGNTNSAIIVIADHGMMDTKKSKTIYIKDHPRLYETLIMPLCGETRVAYCYVHPNKIRQFENYIKTELNHCCRMYKSEELLKKNLFGLYKPHKMLQERVGDYILIMKDDYVIKDRILTEKPFNFIGNHGGLSKEEMLVPLVYIKDI